MIPDELPLLNLFNQLREHDLSLGIEEYMAVLKALRAGFGVGGRRELKQLCCTVWIKNDEETRLFNRLFEQMLAQAADDPDMTSSDNPMSQQTERPWHSWPNGQSEKSDITSPDNPILQQNHRLEKEMERPRDSSPTEHSHESPPSEPHQSSSDDSDGSVSATDKSDKSEILSATDLTHTTDIDEPVRIAQAIRRNEYEDIKITSRYNLLTDYFPVTRRQMKQSWRNLRRMIREGRPEELDVTATIEKIVREGILLEPVLVPRRSNRSELLLLIDRDGSMVPFHSLSRQLTDVVLRGGRLKKADIYYFHDYPNTYLYRDSARVEARLITEIFETAGERVSVLIFSDAGAARGKFDENRVKRTQEFILQLKEFVRCFAWLNPMPNQRWAETTAGEIARFVPMFEMNRRGLDAAINALRGRYVFWEKMYPWMM